MESERRTGLYIGERQQSNCRQQSITAQQKLLTSAAQSVVRNISLAANPRGGGESGGGRGGGRGGDDDQERIEKLPTKKKKTG